MSELRKWEDLDFDCLVDIFERLDMESLLLGVPFVCKSWYKASRSPSCWQHIDFGEFCDHDNYEQTYSTCVLRFIDAYQVQRFSFGKFVRLIVARGLGQSTCLVLPLGCSYKALNHVAKMCPEVEYLALSFEGGYLSYKYSFPKYIGKWKFLEELSILFRTAGSIAKIVVALGRHCEYFERLEVIYGDILKKEASAIAKHLPKIKRLSLLECFVEHKYLEKIICKCKDLEFFEVREGKFERPRFELGLRELGSHIKTLILEEFS